MMGHDYSPMMLLESFGGDDEKILADLALRKVFTVQVHSLSSH